MSERVTPRTVWAALREMYPPEVLVKVAKVGLGSTLIYGLSLLLFFIALREWFFIAAAIPLVVVALTISAGIGILRLIEWIRW